MCSNGSAEHLLENRIIVHENVRIIVLIQYALYLYCASRDASDTIFAAFYRMICSIFSLIVINIFNIYIVNSSATDILSACGFLCALFLSVVFVILFDIGIDFFQWMTFSFTGMMIDYTICD